MSFEYFTAERIDLDLAHGGHASLFEPTLQAADTGEEREDVHAVSPNPRSTVGTSMSSG